MRDGQRLRGSGVQADSASMPMLAPLLLYTLLVLDGLLATASKNPAAWACTMHGCTCAADCPCSGQRPRSPFCRLRRARASTLPPSSRTGPAPLPPHLQLAEPPPRPAEPPRQPARIVRAVPARLAAGPSRVAEPPPLLPAGHKPRQPGPCPAEPLSAASLLPRCLERRTSWGPALVAGEPGETLAELPRTKLPAWDSAELGWCCAVSWPGQAGSLALGGGGALTWLARLTVVGCVAAFEKPVYALCLCDSCFSAGPIKAGGCCELAGNAA